MKRFIVGLLTRRFRGLAGTCAALIATIVLAASASASAGTPNTWTPVAPLSTGRFIDTSVRLHNGDVLVAGGMIGSGAATNSVEIYDPGTNTWSSGGAMSTPRFAAVAVTLPSGRVLIVGGSSDNSGTTSLDTGEVYDPATNTWTSVANTMSSPRGNYPAVAMLRNGTVLIAGGSDASGNPVASADVYNPATNSFTHAAPMATARQLSMATLLPSGKVLVAGGEDATSNPIQTAEIYDPATDTWSSPSNSMSVPRTFPGVAPLPNGDVLVAGGLVGGNFAAPSATTATTDIYIPSTNSFSAGPPMAASRALFGITPLADGRVLVAGGFSISGRGSGSAIDDTEIYDPQTNSWSEAEALPAVGALTLNLLPNGQALEAGGTIDIHNGVTQAELFTPATAPGAPVAVSATPGSRSAYVTFAPAVSDGGFQTLHYTITASSGQTVTTPDGRTFATVTGLTNGRKVTFTITATNRVGTGAASAPSNAVTPMAPPARDKAPKLRIRGLAKRISLTRFLGGIRFSVKPNKAASLQISLLATASGATIARAGTLTLAGKHMVRSAKRRRVLLVPLTRLVGHPRKARVELVIVAIDKAGSRSTTSRWILLR